MGLFPRVREILSGLIPDVPWEGAVGTLSGGQRRRVDLARLLIGTYDVLMLDEPTNHLDMRTINWLAHHLKTRWQTGAGALLMVTHDRWFLDEVCTSMWEVHDGSVDPFEGGYSAYILQRVERDRRAQVEEERRRNMARKELAWLSRGAQARSTKPKFRVEAARELIADVPPLRNELELKRLAVARLGRQVIDVLDVTAGYPDPLKERNGSAHRQEAPNERADKPVLENVTWLIGAGDRFGLLGENGAGKSTLIDIIQGKLKPLSGRVKIGQTVRFGVLSQQLDELQPLLNDTIREVLSRYKRSYIIDGKETSPEKLLERLGFTQEQLWSRIGDLSGGQRRRLQLMLTLLKEPNVLILDEPGNDLDTDMLAIVEDLLDGWPGTLILVTHDRYLMERVTDQQFALIDGHLRHVPGGVDEYLRLASSAGLSGGQGDRLRLPARAPASPTRNLTELPRPASQTPNVSACARRPLHSSAAWTPSASASTSSKPRWPPSTRPTTSRSRHSSAKSMKPVPPLTTSRPHGSRCLNSSKAKRAFRGVAPKPRETTQTKAAQAGYERFRGRGLRVRRATTCSSPLREACRRWPRSQPNTMAAAITAM